MAEIWTNNAASTLRAAITNAAASLSVRAGEGAKFPNPTGGDYFWLTLEKSTGIREIVKVTARAGDTMTIVRAQQGTSAQAFAIGDTAAHRLTAATLATLQAGMGGGGGGGGDTRQFSQADIDGLTWINQGTCTLTKDPSVGIATLLIPSGETNSQARIAKKDIPSPSGNWRYRSRVWMAGPNTEFQGAGLCLRESGTGKLIMIVLYRSNSSPTNGIRIFKFTNETTFSSEPYNFNLNDFVHWMRGALFEVERIGSTLKYRWSLGEGGQAFEVLSESVTAFFTTQPDQIGIVGYKSAAFDCYSNYGFLEKVS